MNIPHDRIFKGLLTTFFPEFLQLFYPDLFAAIETPELLEVNKELFGPEEEAKANEADIVYRARYKPGMSEDEEVYFLIHLEHQSTRDYKISQRMYDYQNRLYHKYHMPVFGVLVCSYDSPLDPEPNSYVMSVAGEDVLNYKYKVLQLNRMNWRDYVQVSNPASIALMTKMGVAKEDRVKVKLACYKLVAGLKLNRRQQEILGKFVESYVKLRGDKQLEFEASIERDFGKRERKKVMEVKEIFREVFEYYAKVDGEVAMLLNSLNYRFGPLTQQIEDHIDELEDDDRKVLGRVMFDFKSAQDLQDWLDQHPV